MDTTSPTNEIIISVAELGRRLKSAAERVVDAEWVEGEVTGLRRATSGHVYFVLRDEREEAVIDCVMYRSAALRSRGVLADGARMQLAGRASFWAPRGRLQFVAERARLAGRGAFLEALERLKQKLAAEGLFEPARKRALPVDPSIIGVVTSAQGAAFQDICTVAFRRGKGRIVLSPALVQGEGAPESIIAAVDLLERYPGIEVMIVGRGGGAFEDLNAFNDERLVRRLARVSVPVVSAVGHDIDVTLADHVADVRAATPSQAAEIVFPDAAEREARLVATSARLAMASRTRLRDDRATLAVLRSRLSDPRFVLAERHMLLDELASSLERNVKRQLSRRLANFQILGTRLERLNPRVVLAGVRARLGPAEERLRAAMLLRVGSARGQLAERAGQLESMSPLAVLARGYAIVSDPRSHVLVDASQVGVGEDIGVHLHRGQLTARVVSHSAPENRGRTSAGRLASLGGERANVASADIEGSSGDMPRRGIPAS